MRTEERKQASSQETVDAAEGLIDTAKYRKEPAQGEAPKEQTPKEEDKNTAGKPTQQPDPADQGKEKETEKPADPIKVDTAFGTSTYGDEENEVKLSSWEDVQAFAKDNGLEIKEVNDFQKVVSELKDLRTKAEKLPELEKSYKEFKDQISSMPNEVAAIYDAALNGNHMDVIKQVAAASEIDFSKHFKEQDVLSLVGRYTGKSFTKEGFEDMDDSTKDALTALAETKYKDEQGNYTNTIKNRQANQAEFQQKFSNSVETSIAKLREKFPKFKDEALNHVKTVMTAGLKESLFNPDNTYRDDAAVRIAMQEYGESALQATQQTIGDMASRLKSKIESDTREQILGRSDIPENRGKQAEMTEDVILKKAKDETSFMR